MLSVRRINWEHLNQIRQKGRDLLAKEKAPAPRPSSPNPSNVQTSSPVAASPFDLRKCDNMQPLELNRKRSGLPMRPSAEILAMTTVSSPSESEMPRQTSGTPEFRKSAPIISSTRIANAARPIPDLLNFEPTEITEEPEGNPFETDVPEPDISDVLEDVPFGGMQYCGPVVRIRTSKRTSSAFNSIQAFLLKYCFFICLC